MAKRNNLLEELDKNIKEILSSNEDERKILRKTHKDLLEQDIEKYLVKKCKQKGLLCYKFSSPSNSGVPDRMIISPKGVIFIELKAPGKEPRPLQKSVIKQMKKLNAKIYVIDLKEDIDKIMPLL